MRLKMASCLVIVMFTSCLTNASQAASETDAFVSQSVTVDAKPKAVWTALQKHRKVTPGRTVVSYDGKSATIRETFEDLPVIGDAQLTYVEREVPFSRIDYRLVESQKIKAFDGSWSLTPSNGGQTTTLQLTSRTDTGLKMPFADTITKKTTAKNVKRRLAEVKRLAETIARSGSET